MHRWFEVSQAVRVAGVEVHMACILGPVIIDIKKWMNFFSCINHLCVGVNQPNGRVSRA